MFQPNPNTEYARMGLHIFPCKPRSKKPATAHGFKDAVTDEGQIAKWWPSDLNVACATGSVSGIIVLDVDKDKGGLASLAEFEKKHGTLPDSWIVRTGGGGMHIYFRHPDRSVRCSAGRLGSGLDIRGDGGYVLLPPSVHESGQSYEWAAQPGEVPLADAPTWLLELISQPKPAPAKKSTDKPVPHGKRDDALCRETGRLRRLDFEQEQIEMLLWDFYERRCEHLPDDDREEIGKRIQSLAERGCRDWEPERNYKLTDKGNAERFRDMYKDVARYCVKWGKWLIWDGKRWQLDELIQHQDLAIASVDQIAKDMKKVTNPDIREKMSAWHKKSQGVDRIGAILRLARGYLAVDSEDFDQDPWKFNVLNGTIDLKTGRLEKHDSSDLITKIAPVVYKKGVDYPVFRRFLNDIMLNDQELIGFLQRFFGYALTGTVGERVFAVFHGTGKNGKSTLLEAVKEMMGDYALNTPAETLLKKPDGSIPNDIARLKGVRFVSASETEENKALAASIVKTLTGKDTISARFMRCDFFDFKPTFKLCLGTNHLPRVSADDQAAWDRIRLVPFDMRIGKDTEEDRDLDRKIELEGVLAWAVEGCLAWQREGLNAPERVLRATDEYREDEDLIASFLSDFCEVEEGARVKAGDVYEAYKEWCGKNGHRSLGSQNLKKRLGKKGFLQTRESKGRFYNGFNLTEEAVESIRNY